MSAQTMCFILPRVQHKINTGITPDGLRLQLTSQSPFQCGCGDLKPSNKVGTWKLAALTLVRKTLVNMEICGSVVAGNKIQQIIHGTIRICELSSYIRENKKTKTY